MKSKISKTEEVNLMSRVVVVMSEESDDEYFAVFSSSTSESDNDQFDETRESNRLKDIKSAMQDEG